METRLLARLLDAARTVGPVAAVTATAAVSSKLAAGDQVRAEVAARLADGSLRVLIAGKPLVLKLPLDLKVGDSVQLRVLAAEPQLKLVLDATQNAAGPRGEVSGAGRLLGTLAGTVAGAPPRQALPIVDKPTAEPAQLTGPLARAIERSGLFYESHQARWVDGDYALERLREEPQAAARLPRFTRPPAPTPASGDSPQAAAAAAPAQLKALAAPLAEATTVEHQPQAATPAALRETRGEESQPEIVARETLPIVRQQLEALETRHLGWLGEIWPGQNMRWEISQEGGDGASAGEARDWSTCFDLNLPALGEVGAALALSPRGLRIALSAHDQATVAAMRGALADLEQALAATGIALSAIQVKHNDAAV